MPNVNILHQYLKKIKKKMEKSAWFISITVNEKQHYLVGLEEKTNVTKWTKFPRNAMAFRTHSGAEHFRFGPLRNRKDVCIIRLDGTGLI